MTVGALNRKSVSESAANLHFRKSIDTMSTQTRPKTRSIESINLLTHPDFGLPDSFFDDESNMNAFNQPLINSNLVYGLKFLRSINSSNLFNDLETHKN